MDKAVAQIKTESGNDKVTGIVADFASVESINNLINELPEVDLLVNNVASFAPKAFADITDEDWLRFYEINVLRFRYS
ncbi:MAG TPA: SDR family NAD(P)-dependent oxidoreductase [Pseudosphingobacterium sp.]|nr:SDR family NAD(P)-dependent oxidoreductase [Pseudosphingobacterium sp.]